MSEKRRKQTERQELINKADKLWDEYCVDTESATGTMLHGVAWTAKDCFDKDSKDYIDETDWDIDNQVATDLIMGAFNKLLQACVYLENTYSPDRFKYFKTFIELCIKMKAFEMAWRMACMGAKKKEGKEYFKKIFDKYNGMKNEQGGKLEMDVFELEVEF